MFSISKLFQIHLPTSKLTFVENSVLGTKLQFLIPIRYSNFSYIWLGFWSMICLHLLFLLFCRVIPFKITVKGELEIILFLLLLLRFTFWIVRQNNVCLLFLLFLTIFCFLLIALFMFFIFLSVSSASKNSSSLLMVNKKSSSTSSTDFVLFWTGRSLMLSLFFSETLKKCQLFNAKRGSAIWNL